MSCTPASLQTLNPSATLYGSILACCDLHGVRQQFNLNKRYALGHALLKGLK